MHTEFHKQLKEKAPKLMESFCETYGYTYYGEFYYNNYLLDSTKIKCVRSYLRKIERLKKKFDANLENFKLDVMPMMGHLSANGYHFDITPSIDISETEYYIKIKRVIREEIIIITMPENYEKHCYFNPALKLACIIACEHLEKSL
jgi:hypothetical protein